MDVPASRPWRAFGTGRSILVDDLTSDHASRLSQAAQSGGSLPSLLVRVHPSDCSTSGARGLASSACLLLDERSAAFDRRPAATSGSVVAFANFRSVAAWSAKYFFPITISSRHVAPHAKTRCGRFRSEELYKNVHSQLVPENLKPVPLLSWAERPRGVTSSPNTQLRRAQRGPQQTGRLQSIGWLHGRSGSLAALGHFLNRTGCSAVRITTGSSLKNRWKDARTNVQANRSEPAGVNFTNVPLSCSTSQPCSIAYLRPALYSAGVALSPNRKGPLIFSM